MLARNFANHFQNPIVSPPKPKDGDFFGVQTLKTQTNYKPPQVENGTMLKVQCAGGQTCNLTLALNPQLPLARTLKTRLCFGGGRGSRSFPLN